MMSDEDYSDDGMMMDEEEEDEEEEEEPEAAPPSPSIFSPELRAVMQVWNNYKAMKKRRQAMGCGGADTGPGDQKQAEEAQKRRKKRRSRVLFPSDGRKFMPKQKERSRAKPFLFLFSIIVFLQVYNAIENLDDHVLKYDLEGLEKTLGREVFGQQRAVETLMEHLQDYLSTYSHQRPLALSVHGPSGVGKSHLGRLLARHFRSVVGDQLVIQYFTAHSCPPDEDEDKHSPDYAARCAAELVAQVVAATTVAEEDDRIPLVVLDEAQLMPAPMLDALLDLLKPDQSNELLNVVYVLLSNLGHEDITRHVLHNSSSSSSSSSSFFSKGQEVEMEEALRSSLAEKQHPLWGEVDAVVALLLLEKSHVVECFLEEMMREGFYPERAHVEQLAAEMAYYSAGGRQYSQHGCKQVVARVNSL